MALQVIGVGEESGDLDGMLVLAAETSQQDAQRALDRWVVLVAPVVTVILGVFVAAIIGSILSAIMSTYNVPILSEPSSETDGVSAGSRWLNFLSSW